MPTYGRFIMAGLSVLLIWKVVNALRTGVVVSRGYTFDINQQPFVFSLGLAVYSLCILFCGWLAAGHTPDNFWHLVGQR